MAYTKLTDFAVKDALLTGNPAKVVRGTEIDAELNAIAAADALNLSAASIVAATSKPTPIDADLLPLVDSAASNVLKKLTWANLKATLLTWLQGTVLPSPGPIGSTTPSTGAFTTLSTTGNVTLGDASTDTVTVNGCIGVGIAANPAIGLQVYSAALTGTNQYGVTGQPTATAAATDSVTGVYASPQTTAAAFTLTDMRGFWVGTGTKGSGSTITNQHGVYINDQTKGTNNYGITSLVSAGTNKWNIYASGTAANYFAGDITTSSNVTFSGVGAVTQAAQNAYTRVIGGTTANVDPTVTLYGSTHANAGLATYDAATHRFRSATGTEYARIDASGNLGLGVTPSAWNSAYKCFQIGASGAVWSATSSGGGTHLSANTIFDAVGFKYIDTNPASDYYQDNGTHVWRTAPSGTAGTAITFTQSLAVGKGTTLALEGATSAAGTGIAFPATQLASSNANTLDDYEEGNWTPTITLGGGAVGVTYVVQTGRYTKIGNRVFFTGYIALTAKGSSTGVLKIASLPFTSNSTSDTLGAVTFRVSQSAASLTGFVQGFTEVNGTSIFVEKFAAGALSPVADTDLNNNSAFIFSGQYFV